MRLKLYRITAFAATSLACAFISFGVPVSAQEAEAEATPIEATINGEAIPTDAKTIGDPTIPVEDLELLALAKSRENEPSIAVDIDEL